MKMASQVDGAARRWQRPGEGHCLTTLPLKSHGSADATELKALLAKREVIQCHCHHRLHGRELEQAPGGGDSGQGSPAAVDAVTKSQTRLSD